MALNRYRIDDKFTGPDTKTSDLLSPEVVKMIDRINDIRRRIDYLMTERSVRVQMLKSAASVSEQYLKINIDNLSPELVRVFLCSGIEVNLKAIDDQLLELSNHLKRLIHLHEEAEDHP